MVNKLSQKVYYLNENLFIVITLKLSLGVRAKLAQIFIAKQNKV